MNNDTEKVIDEEPKNELEEKKLWERSLKEKARPVSPINGQPLPKGKQFTSETAREARDKRTAIEAERKSIARAFKKNMLELHEMRDRNGKIVSKTGAEIIAESIMVACNKGNANAMNIALGLMGEKPAEKIMIAEVEQSVIDEVERMVLNDD